MATNKKQQKIIDEFERRVALSREFMNDWLLFNQILSAYPSPGVNKAELENQFLKIKSKLAREHNVLRDTLQSDYKLDGNTMNIVSGATNLESIYATSEVAVKKLQTEWHRAFISINETLGSVEDKKRRAESGEKVFIAPTGDGAASGGGGMSPGLKKGMIFLGIAVVIGIILFLTGAYTMWVDAFKELMGDKGSGDFM